MAWSLAVVTKFRFGCLGFCIDFSLTLRQIFSIMSLLVIILGLLTGTLLAAIVGLIGSHRAIGFGWAFLLSVVFSPLIGLIVTLFFQKLPDRNRKWGCFGAIIGFIALFLVLVLASILIPGCLDHLQSFYQSLK